MPFSKAAASDQDVLPSLLVYVPRMTRMSSPSARVHPYFPFHFQG
jgi:hypothetical protein